MKKYLLLTSVLTLVACGGGSGGKPREVFGKYVDPVGQSNAAVTGMVSNSEYQIARYVANKLGNDAGSVNLLRGATTRGPFVPSSPTGNIDYDTARELVDLAAWLADSSTSEDDIVSMFQNSDADKNKIKAALKLMNNMRCFVGGSAETTAKRIVENRAAFQTPLANLQQNTELFDLRNVEFVMAAASGGGGDEGGSKDILTFDIDDQGHIIAVNHIALVKNNLGALEPSQSESATFERNMDANGNYVDNTFDVGQINGEGKIYTGNGIIITYGKDIGLRYSDFGQLKYDLHWTNGNQSGDEKSYEPFAGGYKEDGIRRESPETAMNFTGKAAGSVSNDSFNKNITGNATLSFNAGVETLNMYFSNTVADEDNTPWYDVQIIRNRSNGANSITFTTNNTLNGNIPENLRFNDFNNENTRTKTDYLVDGYNGGEYGSEHTPGVGHGKIDIGYYGGRNDGVTEATGVTQYVEPLSGDGEIRMNVGFGMTKNNIN